MMYISFTRHYKYCSQRDIKLNATNESWRSYYRNLWHEGKNSKDKMFTVDPQGLDDVSFEKIVGAIEQLENRKATGWMEST